MNTCETCRFYMPGECRRFPPQMAMYHADSQNWAIMNTTAVFPNTQKISWCGEHQPKEPDNADNP